MYKRIIYNGMLTGIRRDSDNACIPLADDNYDYLAVLKYCEDNFITIDSLDAIDESPKVDNSIEVRRNKAIVALTLLRDEKISSGVIYNNHEFNSDAQTQLLMSYALSSHERGISLFPTPWGLKDGTVLIVSYDDLKAVSGLIAAKVQAAYINYLTLLNQINTNDYPENIDINTGW